MVQFMNLFELFNIVMCVHLRGSKAAMAQQVFNSLYIGTIVQQMRGKGVPQHVRAFFR